MKRKHAATRNYPAFTRRLFILGLLLVCIGIVVFMTYQRLSIQGRATYAIRSKVSIQNGSFLLNGSIFNVVGTNWNASYANSPNYVITQPVNVFADPYYSDNKTVVEAELADMQTLGINTLSLMWPIYETTASNAPSVITNVKDFVTRAKNHGLLLSIYLPPCDVFPTGYTGYDEKKCIEMLKSVSEIVPDNLFAIEIVWEPGTSDDYARRVQLLDKPWKEWLIERYGSLDNAKQSWGYTSTDLPNVTNFYTATADQSPVFHAYYRFHADYFGKKVNDVANLLRTYAPDVLISGRTGYSPGLPPAFLLETIAKPFDFIGLESYSLPVGVGTDPTTINFQGNGFYIEYARTLSGGKPVIFFEYGLDTLDDACKTAARKIDPACYAANPLTKQQLQADFYEKMFTLVKQTNANGLMNWFYAGKRPIFTWADQEYSDYGIRELQAKGNTSGLGIKKLAWDTISLNSATIKGKSMRLYTGEIITDPEITLPQNFYRIGAEKFAELILNGSYPQVKTAGTGTNSINTPDLCVSNKPYTGTCPHKYLNAYFDYIEILNAQNIWQKVDDGASVQVITNRPVIVRAKVSNTGQATWLPTANAQQKGAVQFGTNEHLGSYILRKNVQGRILPNQTAVFDNVTLTTSIDSPVKVVFQMSASWKAWFGEQIMVNLQPVEAPTITPSPTATPTVTPSRTPSPTISPSVTPSTTPTKTPTATSTPSMTPSVTPSRSPTPTPSSTLTPSVTGTPSPSLSPTVTPTVTNAPASARVYPYNDTYIRSNIPDANYSTSSYLQIDGNPQKTTFIRFNLAQFQGKQITRMRFRGFVIDPSVHTQRIRIILNQIWSSTRITFASKPDITLYPVVKTIRGGVAGTWVTIDLTRWLRNYSGQMVSITFESEEADGLIFSSFNTRVIQNRPYLEVDYR